MIFLFYEQRPFGKYFRPLLYEHSCINIWNIYTCIYTAQNICYAQTQTHTKCSFTYEINSHIGNSHIGEITYLMHKILTQTHVKQRYHSYTLSVKNLYRMNKYFHMCENVSLYWEGIFYLNSLFLHKSITVILFLDYSIISTLWEALCIVFQAPQPIVEILSRNKIVFKKPTDSAITWPRFKSAMMWLKSSGIQN